MGFAERTSSTLLTSNANSSPLFSQRLVKNTGCGYMKKIKHCKKCKDGRLIALKPRGLMFCGFCGAEYGSKF